MLHAVVVNYCQWEETVGCVRSLAEAGVDPDRVVVVENASPDGSMERLTKRLPDYRIVRTSENRGYGSGANAGIREVLGEGDEEVTELLFVNPDARMEADTVDGLREALHHKPEIGGVNAIEWRTDEKRSVDPVQKKTLDAHGIEPAELGQEVFVRTAALGGAATLFSAEAIRTVGGFDPIFFIYGEENDLSRRMRYHGYEVGLAARADIVHRRAYLETGEERSFQRRTSAWLYPLKNPYRPAWRNVLRCFRLTAQGLASAAIKEGPTVTQWPREALWILRRVPRALRNRKKERAGPAHL